MKAKEVQKKRRERKAAAFIVEKYASIPIIPLLLLVQFSRKFGGRSQIQSATNGKAIDLDPAVRHPSHRSSIQTTTC
ncbi:hypothetical protein G7K_2151-t1 [Saitoella complicata NRRL Y-17804]|uniref:Uncharacterized protein n=1 Tax=Saitoella complicata (strain BCRC 22490 / CBS 7301 / JCM 7358 / NBRC 10748 / NRRL Y-17804) TaxID=698492 RepID=A0A0E9NDN1_SAICN|nr:hypothetical protein G7K_2151-t1 [Saitoella complicata NRRL Y-17804]